jgi:F-type H+-transporting ATPase subunit gamma
LASPREIKKRIVSVSNTKKITRTMEMVATAKSKKMSNKVNASKPYSDKIKELIGSLSSLSSTVESPLLRVETNPKKLALVVFTANRGLCGGYNSNSLRMAKAKIADLKSKGIEYDLYAIGKKSISYFKFAKEKVKQSFINIDDNSGYKEAEYFANLFMDEFSEGKIDAVEVISTQFISSAEQKADITKVLPIVPSKGKSEVNDLIIYEPSPASILNSLLPQVIKTTMYKIILEAVCSEQIARRIAMKSATDAATDMIKSLTRGYNRARQSKITQEISEIVAGADSQN